MFWKIKFALTHNWALWMVSFMVKNPRESMRYTSVVRAVELLGDAFLQESVQQVHR